MINFPRRLPFLYAADYYPYDYYAEQFSPPMTTRITVTTDGATIQAVQRQFYSRLRYYNGSIDSVSDRRRVTQVANLPIADR